MTKKKKSKTSLHSPETRESRQAEEKEKTYEIQYSAIALNVQTDSSTKKTSRTITEENDRVIYIHENDARGFCVRNGEEVIVIQVDMTDGKGPLSSTTRTGTGPCSPPSVKVSWKSNEQCESNQPRFASICRVSIISNNNDRHQNKLTSPRLQSGGGPAKKNNFPKEGEAHILPSTLSQKIWDSALETPNGSEAKGDVLKSPVAVAPPAPAPAPSPSPSKQQFTFEAFVGSPDNKNKTPSKSSTPQTKPKQKAQSVIALLSLERSEEAYRLLTSDAERLTLRLLDSPSSSFFSKDVLKKSEKVLGRMVQALCHGRHFSSTDIITISFQGKKLQFVVEDIDCPKGEGFACHVNDLAESMRAMSIFDGDVEQVEDYNDPHAMANEIIHQLNDRVSNPVLLRVNYQTQVTFEFDNKMDDLPGEMPLLVLEMESAKAQNLNIDTSKRLVAGLDSITNHILSLLIPTLFQPERFPRSGPIRAPKGVLLHGSSGCGKSLLAEQIALNIKNAEGVHDTARVVDTVRVNCASIQSSTSIMGEAERKLTRVFETAERRALRDNVSTLLLLDDVHLICPRRGAAGDGTGVERVASTLLALMDGIGKGEQSARENENTNYGSIAILAITTNPSLLDPALRRAGRLDAEVEVPSPDDQAKSEIISLCLDNLKHENIIVPTLSESELMALSRLGKGFTGADCTLSIKEAVRGAISRQRTLNVQASSVVLTYADIQQAIRVTKPSAIKSITVEIPRVPWSSIGGMESVKRSLREAIELPLTHSHLFAALRIPPPRGVLLYGPPGCSKTLMARALATEGNMNFLAVKGPELLSKWLGESERALASLFRRARLASPCVIFFDEIDAIASKRGSGESSGGERMLSQLLTELDGVTMTGGATFSGKDKNPPRVVVVGATNRPDILDPALLRPGRIDRMIYVGIPDEETRKAIFMLQLKGKACDPNLDVRK